VVAEWLHVWLKAPPPASTTSTAPRRVVLVSTQHTFAHYFTIARKLVRFAISCNIYIYIYIMLTAIECCLSQGSNLVSLSHFHFVDLLSAPHASSLSASSPASSASSPSPASATAPALLASALDAQALYARLQTLCNAGSSCCIAIDNISVLAALNSAGQVLDLVGGLQALTQQVVLCCGGVH
jgi:hypothetical protein